jgi:hypothetical protein
MSDPFMGARAPDVTPRPVTEAYPATTYATTTEPYSPEGRAADGGDDSAVKQAAGQSANVARQAAGEVKDTAKEQAQRVGAEARTQARTVAADVRGKVSDQTRAQNDKLVGGIRQMADQLDEMRGDKSDSPAATVVSRVADGGRQLADYLDRNGPEGVLREVQDFARRRPGAFLASALAAGFVVGRLGKSVMKAGDGSAKPSSDSFVSGAGTSYGAESYGTQTYRTAEYADPVTGYADPAASTEYASTGTGTPVAVEEIVPGTPRVYPGGTR